MTAAPGCRRVVVASDAFKGSLGSIEVGEAVRLGVLDVVPNAVAEVVGVADGGEGTVAAVLSVGWRAVPVQVHGPTGAPVVATLAVDDTLAVETTVGPVRGDLAVGTTGGDDAGVAGPRVLVELADTCGLGRLPGGVAAPLTASSRGLGEALRAALDLGPSVLVIGVGGSASTDGGAGMLAALGARVLDASGADVPDGGAALSRAARLDLTGLDPRLAATRLVLAADVDSPLLGAAGAAAVFGPQKGATPDDVATLEAALTHWATLVQGVRTSTNRSRQGQPGARTSTNRSPQGQEGVRRSSYWSNRGREAGAGAAGGVGFALLAVLGAERCSGVDTILDLVGLDDRLAGADLVITGEGSLDAQTLAGKAVAGIARRAAAASVPVVAVCGRLALAEDELRRLGVAEAFALSDLERDPTRSMADAADLLREVGRDVARRWLSP